MNRVVAAVCMALFLFACAQVREPQGGPKDTRPPGLAGAEPPNGSTGFSGNTIVLHFDERVKLDRVHEKLLVSPPLAKPPVVQVAKGTEVIIALQAPLADSTTYTFNIGEAVLDLSEGNPAAGLTYVASTGPHLDSLTLQGRVIEARSGKPAADVQVILQDARDTGDVRTVAPQYFTRTKADGSFLLTHLQAGAMRLYALRDRNGNFRFDLPAEEAAFLAGTVDPRDTLPHLLRLFQALPDQQMVQGSKVLPERGWQLLFARPAGEVALHSLDRSGDKLRWWPEWNPSRDTLVMWPSDTAWLAGQRFVLLEDGRALDTLTYHVSSPMPFNLGLVLKQHPAGNNTWQLESTRPVLSVDTAFVMLRADTVVMLWAVHPDSIHGRTIGLDLAPQRERSLELTLFPKAVTALMGGTNDTTKLTLGATDPRALGKLKVLLEVDSGLTAHGPFVLQLTAGQGRVVREAHPAALPAEVVWEQLVPGSYEVQLIEDRDGDGRWSTGSYPAGKQPERVFLDPDPVQIRAGWSVKRAWSLANFQK